MEKSFLFFIVRYMLRCQLYSVAFPVIAAVICISERIKRIRYFWYLYEITVESQCGYIGMTMKY